MDDSPKPELEPEPEPELAPVAELPTLRTALTAPLPVECLACYVWRMLDTYNCNATLRWARQWRDARAPRATRLEERLCRRHGCCDCELFLNVWVPSTSSLTLTADVSWRELPPGGPCAGVRRGSAQPCRLWVTLR